MFIKVFADTGSKCTLYTVHKDEDAISETRDFFSRMYKGEFKEDARLMALMIYDVIGDEIGAHDDYFTRLERKATALPPKKSKKLERELCCIDSDFDGFLNSRLRLYAYKVSESVVVLFNGDVKLTDGLAQKDPKVSMYFQEAQIFTQKIMEAIRDGMICVNHKSMVDFQGNKEIYI